MVYLIKGKVKVLDAEKNGFWDKQLKEHFPKSFQDIIEYMYFVHGRNTHTKYMTISDRKMYSFRRLSGKHFKSSLEIEQNEAYADLLASYLKIMRTETEQRIYAFTERIDQLQVEVLSVADYKEVSEKLKIINNFQDQVGILENKRMMEDSENIKPVGMNMYEIPNENLFML